jgi:hypothetical protein
VTLLRAVFALVTKYVVHHGPALFGAGVLTVAAVLSGWVLVLAEEQTSLLSAATGAIYYIGPMLVLFVVDRSFARDQVDGTSEFLAALPLGSALRLGVPFALGLLWVSIIAEGILLSTALFATRREGVPFLWLLQLHAQCGLYLFAWYALAFGVVHTGRWRWLVWWLVFNIAFGISGWAPEPFRTVFWHAVLADPIEQSRSIPPLDAVPITGAWALGGIALGLFLALWRGGSLPARWFAAADARQRSMLVVGAVLGPVLGSLIDETAPVPDTWRRLDPLPAEHADIRVAGSERLADVGQEVVRTLDRLGSELQLPADSRWPTVVLHPATRTQERHVRRATSAGRSADASLVLLVDPEGPRETLVRDMVTEVLARETGDAAARLSVSDDDAATVLWGGAGWARTLVQPGVNEALATRLALVDDPSASLPHLERTRGRDLAEAVAVGRLATLSEQEGPEAVRCLVEALLVGGGRAERAVVDSVLDALALERRAAGLADACGVDPSEADPAVGPLGRAASTLGPLVALAPPVPPITLQARDDAMWAQFAWPAPQGAVLRRQAIDPLEADAPPFAGSGWGSGIWRVQPAGRRDELHLGYSPTQLVVVELAVYWPPIEGFVSSGRFGPLQRSLVAEGP